MARTADPAVRTALIEEAAALLATGGIGALSTRRLTAAVDASTTAVYTHFGGKDELVRAVVREAFARLEADLSAVDRTLDPLADLAAVGAAYRHNALANAHLYRVMFGLNPLALYDPAVARSQSADADGPGGSDDDLAVALAGFEVVVAAVARCVDAGVVRGDALNLATQLWAAAHGAVSLELAGFLADRGGETFDAATAAVITAALA